MEKMDKQSEQKIEEIRGRWRTRRSFAKISLFTIIFVLILCFVPDPTIVEAIRLNEPLIRTIVDILAAIVFLYITAAVGDDVGMAYINKKFKYLKTEENTEEKDKG